MSLDHKPKCKQNAPDKLSPPQGPILVENNNTFDHKLLVVDNTHHRDYVGKHAELATALISVKLPIGFSPNIRALCDSGSQVNLITKTCVKRLGLIRRASDVRMRGYDGVIGHRAQGMVTISARNRFSDEIVFTTDAYVVSTLPTHIPAQPIEPAGNGTEYADDKWNVPSMIEMLLGAGIWAKIILPEIAQLPNGMVRQASLLGQLVFGVHLDQDDSTICCAATLNDASASLTKLIEKMWESERYDDTRPMSAADEWCQQDFADTHYRQVDGRYVAKLPIDPAAAPLGDSRRSALRQFYQLEGRFKKNPELAANYIKFMREYEQLGHMCEVDPAIDRGGPKYYIPHHAVLKKFRVVFNASAPTTNGLSLNSIQFTGPRLQADITDIVTNFRRRKVAFCADIEKMYRQIALHPDHWNYQRIFWRENPGQPLKEYWLVRVTYGVTASGYMAVRALQQCATDHADAYPRAAEVAKSAFYVDDLLTCADTREDALALKHETSELLAKGGFKLAKWISNEPAILDRGAAQESAEKSLDHADDPSILGLKWDPKHDTLMINVRTRVQPRNITKRQLVSECARIYDPLVFLAPTTITAKRFIKEAWAAKIGWDESIPAEMQNRWDAFYASLHALAELRIPRWLGCAAKTESQLHIFADASQTAMGAVAYLVVRNGSKIHSNVLMSINRLAPKAEITIPRMELSAAVLAVQLKNKLASNEACKDVDTYFWTDSTIVLHWLRKESAQMKVFVANRVAKIQRNTQVDRWGHVRSAQNPADLLSRGITAAELLTAQIWWEGPRFIREEWYEWAPWRPPQAKEHATEIEAEMRPAAREPISAVLTYKTKPHRTEASLLERSETLNSLLSATVRFMKMARHWLRRIEKKRTTKSTLLSDLPGDDNSNTWITREQWDFALKYWVQHQQRIDFAEEYTSLSKKQPLRTSSRLRADTPCIIDGIMRVWGRLDNMETAFDTKHPMIVDGKSHLAKLLIADAHERLSHGTPGMMRVYLRARFHILGCRVAARKYCRNCLTCARYNAKVPTQMMADLPAVRVNPAKAFYSTGVDYAGPFLVKRGRGQINEKVYAVIFVCMVTKAIHVEVATDMTTNAMLAALDRLIAVRAGQVRHIYCDNGRNFVGAERALREAVQSWEDMITSARIDGRGIIWHFNAPINPHAGGLWERGVRSVKTHLHRLSGSSSYTYEELITLLARVTTCLNSRPLSSMSDDPHDMTVLTPGHFLVGGPMVQPWAPDYTEIPENRLTSWQKLHAVQQGFWKRWSSEYVMELQRRNKWINPKRNFQIGDLVLLRNEASPPTDWLTGRIDAIFPGPDGLVRTVDVRTNYGTFRRPIGQLCLLPVDSAIRDDYVDDQDDAASADD